MHESEVGSVISTREHHIPRVYTPLLHRSCAIALMVVARSGRGAKAHGTRCRMRASPSDANREAGSMFGWRLGNLLPPVERMIARPTRSKATPFGQSLNSSVHGPSEHQCRAKQERLHLSLICHDPKPACHVGCRLAATTEPPAIRLKSELIGCRPRRASVPSKTGAAPFVTTSPCSVTLDANSQPPLSHPPFGPVAQPRRVAPGENNCPSKPVDRPLPPTLPLHRRRQLPTSGTSRASVAATTRAPPQACKPATAILFVEPRRVLRRFFFFATLRNPYHVPGSGILVLFMARKRKNILHT